MKKAVLRKKQVWSPYCPERENYKEKSFKTVKKYKKKHEKRKKLKSEQELL